MHGDVWMMDRYWAGKALRRRWSRERAEPKEVSCVDLMKISLGGSYFVLLKLGFVLCCDVRCHSKILLQSSARKAAL